VELSRLLCETLRLPEPIPALSADEPLFGGRLPLDSVDSLQWATAIERHFDIELTDDEIGQGALLTLGQMARVIHQRNTPNGIVE
jgi:acyl carrier protein